MGREDSEFNMVFWQSPLSFVYDAGIFTLSEHFTETSLDANSHTSASR